MQRAPAEFLQWRLSAAHHGLSAMPAASALLACSIRASVRWHIISHMTPATAVSGSLICRAANCSQYRDHTHVFCDFYCSPVKKNCLDPILSWRRHWQQVTGSFCCLRYYWPFYSVTMTQKVWIKWNFLILVSPLPFISVLFWYQWHQIPSLSTSLRCSSGFCSWSSFQSLYNSTQHNNLSIICQPQILCRWHSTRLIIFSRCFLKKIQLLQDYIISHFFMDGFKLSISYPC